MAEPFAFCRLCEPPEPLGKGVLMDHLRVLHPERYESLFAAGRITGPDPEPGAPFTHPVVTADDLEPHGARCCDCGRLFRQGDSYATRLIGVVDGILATEMLCLRCGEPGS